MGGGESLSRHFCLRSYHRETLHTNLIAPGTIHPAIASGLCLVLVDHMDGVLPGSLQTLSRSNWSDLKNYHCCCRKRGRSLAYFVKERRYGPFVRVLLQSVLRSPASNLVQNLTIKCNLEAWIPNIQGIAFQSLEQTFVQQGCSDVFGCF